jgi:hypothetical protein
VQKRASQANRRLKTRKRKIWKREVTFGPEATQPLAPRPPLPRELHPHLPLNLTRTGAAKRRATIRLALINAVQQGNTFAPGLLQVPNSGDRPDTELEPEQEQEPKTPSHNLLPVISVLSPPSGSDTGCLSAVRLTGTSTSSATSTMTISQFRKLPRQSRDLYKSFK